VGIVRPCSECPHYVAAICDTRTESAGEPSGRPPACESCEEPPARDAGAFQALFERYQRHVVAWSCRMLGRYDVGRDVAQDVFVKAWSNLEAFRGQASVSTWLYTITRNACNDYLRARAARPFEVDERAADAKPPVVENDALRRLEAEEAAQIVGRLMRTSRLRPDERRAFTLHYGYDVPLQTLTRQLGLANPSGVRATLVSATRKLRRSADRWRRLERERVAGRAA
jgi:RNA polymerase sigma-70 factor (ECF subfamily)